MSRRTLSDAQWALIERLVPGKKGDRGRTAVDNRPFLDAILWLARAASLQSYQTLPQDRPTLRKIPVVFPRLCLSRMRHGLVSLNEDTV